MVNNNTHRLKEKIQKTMIRNNKNKSIILMYKTQKSFFPLEGLSVFPAFLLPQDIKFWMDTVCPRSLVLIYKSRKYYIKSKQMRFIIA